MSASKASIHPAPTADREIVISRLLDAPRQLVWEAWVNPEHVVQWWGPTGFTTTIHEMDVRPGGVWRHTMHGPDGTDYPNKSVFVEVVEPERIVFSHGGGKKGAPGAHFQATWTFEAQGNKTLITGRLVFATPAERDHVVKEYGAIEGGQQTLARLAAKMERTPVVIERILNASPSRVWQAITDISQMKQWYMVYLESFKPEVGFETRFNVRKDGQDFLHIWKVTEVVPEKKISYSWKYAGYTGDSLVTFELVPQGQHTMLKLTHSGLETFDPQKFPALARGNFLEGWTALASSLEQFVEKGSAPSRNEFIISRVFDAPRELVWRVWTQPEHMTKWWGPVGLTMLACKVDLRPGGLCHYGMRTPDGPEMWGKFVYREITPPEKLVFVNSFSDAQGGITRHPLSATWPLEVLNTMTLTEKDGKTTLTLRGGPINATEEERRTFATSFDSMNKGFGGTFDQLAAYLAKVQA
jgi:uncharacterized protein YndB with AHSA1/START domain